MTKINLEFSKNTLLALIAILAFGFVACDDDNDVRDVDLDPELFGRWELRNPAGKLEYAWEFNDDGTAVQFIYDDEYDWVDKEIDWLWEIKDEQLKYYVEDGVPIYRTYKVEDNRLYFWAEGLDMWGVPYIKA